MIARVIFHQISDVYATVVEFAGNGDPMIVLPSFSVDDGNIRQPRDDPRAVLIAESPLYVVFS